METLDENLMNIRITLAVDPRVRQRRSRTLHSDEFALD